MSPIGIINAGPAQGLDVESWYMALQTDANGAATTRFYGEEHDAARLAEQRARLDADRARIGRRALELGRMIVVGDKERRQQTKASDGRQYLQTWVRREAEWILESMMELSPTLYIKSGMEPTEVRVFFPPARPASAETAEDFLLRLVEVLQRGAADEAVLKREFVAVGARPAGIGDITAALADHRRLPSIKPLSGAGAEQACDVAAGSERFEVRVIRSDSGWRIREVVETPGPKPHLLTMEDSVQIAERLREFADALATKSATRLRACSLDSRGSMPSDLADDAARDRLLEWGGLLGGTQVAAKMKDLLGGPADDRVFIPFANASGVVRASVWLGRSVDSWRVMDVFALSTTVEPVRPGDVVK